MTHRPKLDQGVLVADRFRIVRLLEEEHSASVYLAEDIGSSTQRALRILDSSMPLDAPARAQFDGDVHQGATLLGARAVRVVASGTSPETNAPWMAMELPEAVVPAAAWTPSPDGAPVAPPPPSTPRPVPWGRIGLIAVGFVVMGLLAVAAMVVGFANANRVQASDVAKVLIALAAMGIALLEALRAALRGRVPEPVKMVLFGCLALGAVVAYFHGFQFGYPKYYHRWDHFHSYVGAKYFKEMGYDGLYRCTAIAQDELGAVSYERDNGSIGTIDMSEEVRGPRKKIRDIGGSNGLIPVDEILANPEACKKAFTPARWEKFKNDVSFFRTQSDKLYWEDMQRDYGFNLPPVWTVAGRFFAEIHPATVRYLQLLSGLDLLYLLGTFAALFWAFGWRVSAVAAIFWGCQAAAPFYWTGGAFLRQDWLFYLVLSVCLVRKRHYRLAGASLVYAALLRVFPMWVAIGWLSAFAASFLRYRRLVPSHLRMLIGAAIAGVVLVGASMVVAGPGAHAAYFARASLQDETPLTNHMGLRPVIAHDFFSEGPGSGRMKYAKNTALSDPFSEWKRMRNDRYEGYIFVAWAIIALSLAGFMMATRRRRLPWIHQCLAQVFVVLLAQLTCYHYSFLILGAPLTRLRRGIEVGLFGLAAVTQIIALGFTWNDDKYVSLSLVALLSCGGLFLVLAGRRSKRRRSRGSRRGPSPVHA